MNMKKKFVYIVISLVAIIAQTSIMPAVLQTNAAADVVLTAVLAWSVLDGFFAFISWAIAIGILYDLVTYSPVGVHVLIFLAVVYFVSFFSRRLSLELKGFGLFLFLIFVVVATLVSQGVIALATAWDMQTFHGYWKSFGSLKSVALGIAYNEILFFIWFILLKKIKKFFEIG